MARGSTDKLKTTQFPTCYIACRVEPGMFREELLAYVTAINPEDPNKTIKVQLLVDQRDVFDLQGTPKRHDPVQGRLRATLVSEQGDWAEVVLPQPSQPLGERI